MGGDECDTVEHSVCKTNTETGVGVIEVTEVSGLCCPPPRRRGLAGIYSETWGSETWGSAGTEIMEPSTCSTRRCVAGRPAYWQRTTVFTGGCGCCEYNGQLLHPSQCVTIADGSEVCCCDGEMVSKLTPNTSGEDTNTSGEDTNTSGEDTNTSGE